jgi:hypothetical protein
MNGPRHYREAEVALHESAQSPQEMALLYATQAVAHATLALAAATVAGRAIGPLEGWGGHHVELLSPGSAQWAEALR